jgi:hypothetical protein
MRDTIGRFGIRGIDEKYRIERSDPFTTTKACRAPTSSAERAPRANLRGVGTADNNAGNPT